MISRATMWFLIVFLTFIQPKVPQKLKGWYSWFNGFHQFGGEKSTKTTNYTGLNSKASDFQIRTSEQQQPEHTKRIITKLGWQIKVCQFNPAHKGQMRHFVKVQWSILRLFSSGCISRWQKSLHPHKWKQEKWNKKSGIPIRLLSHWPWNRVDIIKPDAFSNFDCQPMTRDEKTGFAPTLAGYF